MCIFVVFVGMLVIVFGIGVIVLVVVVELGVVNLLLFKFVEQLCFDEICFMQQCLVDWLQLQYYCEVNV